MSTPGFIIHWPESETIELLQDKLYYTVTPLSILTGYLPVVLSVRPKAWPNTFELFWVFDLLDLIYFFQIFGYGYLRVALSGVLSSISLDFNLIKRKNRVVLTLGLESIHKLPGRYSNNLEVRPFSLWTGSPGSLLVIFWED